MKTIAICNLGCSKNIIDGEKITAYLDACNFKILDTFEEADIIIVEPINISPEEKKTCWEELPSCRYIMESIKLGCCILLLSYIIGALSIADHIRYTYSKWKPEHHVIALVVGICEFCIVSYCCWRSLCYPRTDSY